MESRSSTNAFVDEHQQIFQFPIEIWQAILNECADQSYPAAQRVAQKVLREVSKSFCHMASKLVLSKIDPVGGQLTSSLQFCCGRAHRSLLLHALANGAVLDEKCCEEAVASGDLELTKFVLDRAWPGIPSSTEERTDSKTLLAQFNVVYVAATKKNLELLKYLLDRFKLPRDVLQGRKQRKDGLVYAAATSGSLEMVKHFAEDLKLRFGEVDVEGCGVSGSREILTYFLATSRRSNIPSSNVCAVAAEHGHKDLIEFAVEKGTLLDEEVIERALETQDLEFIKYLVAIGCPMRDKTMTQAARRGDVNIVRYLHEKGCPFEVAKSLYPSLFDACSTVAAAEKGHMDCLRYMMENGAPWPDYIIEQVARKGQLEAIKYLREWGCPCDVNVMNAAATGGYVALVKYLHETNCPWNTETTNEAALRGHVDCVSYLLDNGCPWEPSLMEEASLSGSRSLELMPMLHSRGIPWTDQTCTILVHAGNYEGLVFAHENGAPWTSETLKKGLKSQFASLQCFTYAVENGCPWDPQECFIVALQVGFDEVVDWLLKNADLPAEYHDPEQREKMKSRGW